MEKTSKILFISAPGREFVLPYISRELPGMKIITEQDESIVPEAAIMLSGTELYAAESGTLLDESTPVRSEHPLAYAERDFCSRCAENNTGYIIFRCANTIGTGMTGYPRKLAEAVYRGFLFHFPHNEAHISAVHASTVAQVCRLALEAGLATDSGPENVHIFNLTDGVHPSFDDLVEALAYRIDHKRVSTLSTVGQQWLGRILYGKERYRRMTTTLTFSDAKLRGILGTEPVPVTQYMREHNYDDQSL